jgi:hypothetical protein
MVPRLTLALALTLAAACSTSRSGPRDAALEFVLAERGAQWPGDGDSQELVGVVLIAPSDAHTEITLGVFGGQFELEGGVEPAGFDDDYLEVELGLRLSAVRLSEPLRPFLGLSLVWNDESFDGHRGRRYRDRYYDDYDDDDLDQLVVWILAHAGVCATLGLEIELGPFSSTLGLRGVWMSGSDRFEPHNDDDFAVEAFVGAGLSW